MTDLAKSPIRGPDPERYRRIGELEHQITELSAHLDAGTWRLLQLIAEFDRKGGWSGPGLKSCAHWLNWKCGIGLGAARERVRVARALEDLPLISEAMRRGEVSYAKVRAMTRIADASNERLLLMWSRSTTAMHLERIVRAKRTVDRREALADDKLRHTARELSWYEDSDGSIVFRGRLTPEDGQVVIRALEKALDQGYAEHGNDAGEDHDYRQRPVASRRADALTRLAETYLRERPTEVNGGDRYTVHLHTHHDILRQDGKGATSELEDGGTVSAETSRRLSCDAGLVRWHEDDDGQPLSIGRKSRTVPPSIRRALRRRDRGCRFPGCSCRRYVDAHHIRHWADGGETALDNLVLLCRYHHRLVHEEGFDVAMVDGRPVFTDPAGIRIPEDDSGRSRGNVIRLVHRHVEQGLGITPRTPIPPYWDGKPPDLSACVEGLQQEEARDDQARERWWAAVDS